MSSFEVRDRGWLFDLTLSSVLALVLVTASHSDPPVAVASLALCCSLMFRRGHPNLALTVGIAGAVALLVVSTMPEPAIVVVPILVYSLARWAPGSQGRIAFGAGLVGSLLGPIRWAQPYLNQDRLGTVALFAVVCAALVIGAFLLGSRLRESRQRDRERVAEAARARGLVEAEQAQRAQVAAISERNRIARELHDIVAHSLSVIVVQAEGGRALAVRRPETAPEVFGTIAETSRQALAETRHIVGLLRGETGPADLGTYAPTPGLDDLDDLVRRTSDGFELSVFGEPPVVSQAVGLTIYRVVQESLTNVLKHGGSGARARVTVAYTADAIELEIADDGVAVPGDGPGGHGQIGMRERLAVYDGTLSAGPRPGGGYLVRARLPLHSLVVGA